MYGSSFDFSGVTLPGVGGGINASNAISTDQLAKMNKSGKKWSPDITGGMSHHNEGLLSMNAKQREKRASLVNRDYNEQADGASAMKEIFDRKKSRMSSFKEMKKNEYGFAEGDSQDSELLSMPMPSMGMAEKKCSAGCNCPACLNKKQQDAKFREWDTAQRKELKKGEFKGEFAGPDMSFPIAKPEDVAAAWSSVGHAKNPRAVMKNIIDIAKRYGWESGLPESVKQRISAGQSGLPE
jgi:hypothetical protein